MMSRSIVEAARRGAQDLVEQAERMLQQALTDDSAAIPLSFDNTVYYLPIHLARLARAVEHVADLKPTLQQARNLLQGEAPESEHERNASIAALLAAETSEALRSFQEARAQSADGGTAGEVRLKSTIGDTLVRKWGVQLADGRSPGIALLLGSARSSHVAAALIAELRRHNLLCLVAGNANGISLSDQLEEQAIEMGERACTMALGSEASSAVHALSFVVRCAMKLGGRKPGAWAEILQYAERRTPGFVLALGKLQDSDRAMAMAAHDFGFTIIADSPSPSGKQVVAIPFEDIAGDDEMQKAARLVEQCIAARQLRLRPYNIGAPAPYGPAFEDEVIPESELQIELGERGRCAFELLQVAPAQELSDGRIQVVGQPARQGTGAGTQELGLVVKVAGARLRADYEHYLERQIHTFINYAAGIQHVGEADSVSLRVSKAAVARGFGLEWLGKILVARFHQEFGTAVEKVEVMLITEPGAMLDWRTKARQVHELRSKQIESLTDSQVDEFYVCTNCRVFAPFNVSIISPERVSPCGKCNWLDAMAAFAINPAGVRRPVKLGKLIDARKGIWEGTNKYATSASHGRVNEVALYSLMQSPMCACGDFECMVVLIPEANGVMVVAHEDASNTPAGINVETLSAISAGEQIPGVVGIGKSYLLSEKFISAEGGFKRVVWMSSTLKNSMANELKDVCMRAGDPKLMDKIADEHSASTVQALIDWLKERDHPALHMERIF